MKQALLAGVSAAAFALSATVALAATNNNTNSDSGDQDVILNIQDGSVVADGVTNSGNTTNTVQGSNNSNTTSTNRDNTDVNNTEQNSNLTTNKNNEGSIAGTDNVTDSNNIVAITGNLTGNSAEANGNGSNNSAEANGNGSNNTAEINGNLSDNTIEANGNGSNNTAEANNNTDSTLVDNTEITLRDNSVDTSVSFGNEVDFTATKNVAGSVLNATVARVTTNYDPATGSSIQGNLLAGSATDGAGLLAVTQAGPGSIQSNTTNSVAVSVETIRF